jgi:SAM-dependent methyltransferase
VNRINDLDLSRWKEYGDLLVDSLWIIEKRDNSGVHSGWYHGNFVPQVPRQLMLRYTRKGEWVLDPFVGSGTTLIECKMLGRNGIGIELNQRVAEEARKAISRELNFYNVVVDVIVGDAKKIDYKELLGGYGISKVQLVILHPPYWDVIKFSDNPEDLSAAKSLEEFLRLFKEVVVRVSEVLEENRYLGLVIGDKYSDGEWVPLGFYCMREVMDVGYRLKGIVVKNIGETRLGGSSRGLWKYRALKFGFFVFAHEYVMVFQKK